MSAETLTTSPVHELLASPPGDQKSAFRDFSLHPRSHVSRPLAPQTDEAFNAIFDSSAEALVVIDSAGVIQRANSRARELLRLQRSSDAAARFPNLFLQAHSE